MEIHGADKIHCSRSVMQRRNTSLFFFFLFSIIFQLFFKGLLLISCGGLHTVWAIFQVLYFDTSEKYRRNWERIGESNNTNDTNRITQLLQHIAFDNFMGLLFTVTIWYVGAIIGSFLAGWYLLPSVQKKNIYVSRCLQFNPLALPYK